MNDKFTYFLYLVFIILITFITFILLSVNSFGIVISIFIIINLILFSCTFKDEGNSINLFNMIPAKPTTATLIENKSSSNANFILLVKQISIVTLFILLFYFNLPSILLTILIIDFIVKLTLDLSLIEFYYNRKISINNES